MWPSLAQILADHNGGHWAFSWVSDTRCRVAAVLFNKIVKVQGLLLCIGAIMDLFSASESSM